MEITLNKKQLEDIIIGLYFTGFIKERHGLENKNTEIIKFLIKKIEENGWSEFIEYGKDKPFLSQKLTKDAMLLACINDGMPVEDIDKTYDETMEYLSQLVKEGKLIIPE